MYVSRKYGTDEERGKLLRSRSSQEDDPEQSSSQQPPRPTSKSPSSSLAAENEAVTLEVASLSPSPSACAASLSQNDAFSLSPRQPQQQQQKHRDYNQHSNHKYNDNNSKQADSGSNRSSVTSRQRSHRKKHTDAYSPKLSPTSITAAAHAPTSASTKTASTAQITSPTSTTTAAAATTINRVGGKRKITSQGSLDSKASTGTRDTIKSTGSTNRRNAVPLYPKVIYYNNRFITITSVADKHQQVIGNNNKNSNNPTSSEQQSRAAAPGSRGGSDAHARGGDVALQLGDAERHVTEADAWDDAALLDGANDDANDEPPQIRQHNHNKYNVDMEHSNSISMQEIDADTGQDTQNTGFVKNSWANTFLAKLSKILQDNRMRDGDEDTAKKLKEMNRNQEQRHQILKRVLNIIFVTTGIVLFLAVIVVIIYTSVASPASDVDVEEIQKLPEITTLSVQVKGTTISTSESTRTFSKRKKKKNRKKNNKRKKNRGKKKEEDQRKDAYRAQLLINT